MEALCQAFSFNPAPLRDYSHFTEAHLESEPSSFWRQRPWFLCFTNKEVCIFPWVACYNSPHVLVPTKHLSGGSCWEAKMLWTQSMGAPFGAGQREWVRQGQTGRGLEAKEDRRRNQRKCHVEPIRLASLPTANWSSWENDNWQNSQWRVIMLSEASLMLRAGKICQQDSL